MKSQKFYLNPRFQVISTWLWLVLFPLSLVGIFVGILGLDMSIMLDWWRNHLYVQAYLETVVAGLLPVIFIAISRERLSCFGIQRKNLFTSVALGLSLVAVIYVYTYLTTGNWINHSIISNTLKPLPLFWYLCWGVFANGPLEILFYVFLIEKTDEIFSSGGKLLSIGFWMTTVLHSLAHIITTQSVGNAVVIFIYFFFLGLIYRRTKNAWGPILGWSLINGMVWAYVTMPWN